MTITDQIGNDSSLVIQHQDRRGELEFPYAAYKDVYRDGHHLNSKDLEMDQKFYDRVLVKYIWYIHIMDYHAAIKKNKVDFYRIWKDSTDTVSENTRCGTVTSETTINSVQLWKAGLGPWGGGWENTNVLSHIPQCYWKF